MLIYYIGAPEHTERQATISLPTGLFRRINRDNIHPARDTNRVPILQSDKRQPAIPGGTHPAQQHPADDRGGTYGCSNIVTFEILSSLKETPQIWKLKLLV